MASREEKIQVKITKFADRTNLLMYYDCPHKGRRISRSTGETDTLKAHKAATQWETQLNEGIYKPVSKLDWADFRKRYEAEQAASLAVKTQIMVRTVFNAVERISNPKKLRDLTAARLSTFQATLREEGKSEQTIKTYLAHLLSSLNWAVEIELLPEVPKVKLPKRAKGARHSKGRPITGEEYDRMIAATASVVGEKAAPSWKRLLEGLWLSGLRLGEASNLYWDRYDKIRVDLSGRRPLLWIRAELEKGNCDRALPITRDFFEFLSQTPQDERRGAVFPLEGLRQKTFRRDVDWIGKVISRIGEKAGVKVLDENGRLKFATAHDLRRAFGTRWAPRVNSATLQKLMRHRSIETTMKYYVHQNAEDIADAAWEWAEKNAPGPAVVNSSSTPAQVQPEAV